MRYRLLLLLPTLLPGSMCGTLHAENLEQQNREHLEAVGEAIFRQGLLPDGSPLKGVAVGNIPMQGEQVACVKCHRRSGLGTSEGSVISWRISGKELYQPRRRTGAWLPQQNDKRKARIPGQFAPSTARPAYTDDSLKSLIRTGINPAGHAINPVMPRYNLDEEAMSALVVYLKNLSAEHSPGVDERTIRFATIVTDGVNPEEEAAMLDVLKTHMKNHNVQTRPHLRRMRDGPFYRSEMNSAYRQLELDTWQLKGDASTWPDQLERYYRERPVFALLGGLASGSWKPIHAFCEQKGLPAIFPLTEEPVISASDWYTQYLSKGAYQEGVSAASYLQGANVFKQDGLKVIQVYPAGGKEALVARGVKETLKSSQLERLTSLDFEPGTSVTKQQLEHALGGAEKSILLLWMQDEQFLPLFESAIARNDVELVFGSWSLLSANIERIAELDSDQRLNLTYPYALPDKQALKKRRLLQWLKVRGIPQRDVFVEDRMYFLGWLLSDVLKQMRNDLYRDYFLESFEMMREQQRAIALYPHVSFGPDQRYAAKGGYIVRYDKEKQAILPVSQWNMKPLKNQRLSGGLQ